MKSKKNQNERGENRVFLYILAQRALLKVKKFVVCRLECSFDWIESLKGAKKVDLNLKRKKIFHNNIITKNG